MKLQFIVTTGARVTELPPPFLTFSLFIFNKITLLFHIFSLSLTYNIVLTATYTCRVRLYISGILLCMYVDNTSI